MNVAINPTDAEAFRAAYEYVKEQAHLAGKSAKEWKSTSFGQSSYWSGYSNACLEIMDWMERHPPTGLLVNRTSETSQPK